MDLRRGRGLLHRKARRAGHAGTLLGFCLLLASQEAQRLKSAAGDKVWTLIGNMGVRITGKIMDPKDTLEILQLMAGTEYLPVMSGMVRQAGIMGASWEEADTLSLKDEKKVSVEEVQQLKEGKTSRCSTDK